MKLSEAMREKMLLSFELFPPKTEKGMANLPGTIEHLMKYRPEYISCTYGAGGGNVGANREVCQMIRNAGTIPVTHFTVIKNTKEGIRQQLERYLADGDAIAEAALTSIYLPVAANMAADMNCTEIQLADLIQEANVVLLTALSDPETERKDDAWLRLQLRKGIIAAIEEQTLLKFQDDCLVTKVEKLESAVKDLTDDDGENRFTIDELAVILDMNVDEIRDILRLTGDDK